MLGNFMLPTYMSADIFNKLKKKKIKNHSTLQSVYHSQNLSLGGQSNKFI